MVCNYCEHFENEGKLKGWEDRDYFDFAVKIIGRMTKEEILISYIEKESIPLGIIDDLEYNYLKAKRLGSFYKRDIWSRNYIIESLEKINCDFEKINCNLEKYYGK